MPFDSLKMPPILITPVPETVPPELPELPLEPVELDGFDEPVEPPVLLTLPPLLLELVTLDGVPLVEVVVVSPVVSPI